MVIKIDAYLYDGNSIGNDDLTSSDCVSHLINMMRNPSCIETGPLTKSVSNVYV